ncbi:MAG: hypothetical protein K2O14_00590 [Oscillospiraceae bacterium]|nr:hypothetical protein [Oscillospiraceae bacterium]
MCNLLDLVDESYLKGKNIEQVSDKFGKPWKTTKTPGFTVCTWRQWRHFFVIVFDIDNIFYDLLDKDKDTQLA